MKQEELIELSKRVAEKLGIPAYEHGVIDGPSDFNDPDCYIWLHEDSARCFELMCEHSLAVSRRLHWESDDAYEVIYIERSYPNYDAKFLCMEKIRTYNDSIVATRVAILRAIGGM